MEINKLVEKDTLTLAIEGRLDTLTSPTLQETINSSLEGIVHLVIDLKKVVYISSAGLRVILSAQKLMNTKGDMVVKNCSAEVLEVFEMTGFTEILTIK